MSTITIETPQVLPDVTPADPASQVLEWAADHIEKCGWWHQTEADPDPGSRKCAAIAINEAPFGNRGDAYRRLYFHVGGTVSTWNDAQTDGATVCRVLREVAAAGARSRKRQ